MEKYYQMFEKLMNEEKVYRNPEMSFKSICREMGVDERKFDRFLFEDLGYSGTEILARYRNEDRV